MEGTLADIAASTKKTAEKCAAIEAAQMASASELADIKNNRAANPPIQLVPGGP